MDIVVKTVVLKAVEVGGELAQKAKDFAKKQYAENQCVRKAVDSSVRAYRGAVKTSVGACKSAGKKVGGLKKNIGSRVTAYSQKYRESEFAKKADETSAVIADGMEKGRDAIESSKLYYQLGKLVYQQAVSPDHASFTYPIVEKIHDIAAIKGDESILADGGWSQDEETAQTPDEKPEDGETEK